MNMLFNLSSRGGLVCKGAVFHSVNSAPSANGGSNPAWVWYIDRSEVETLCRNSNCRVPGAAMPLRYMPQELAVSRWELRKPFHCIRKNNQCFLLTLSIEPPHLTLEKHQTPHPMSDPDQYPP